jgi:hypothetical protein
MIKGHNFPGGKCVMPSVPKSPPGKNIREDISIRPIQNGYVVTKSRSGDKGGKYFHESTETYTPTKPKF